MSWSTFSAFPVASAWHESWVQPLCCGVLPDLDVQRAQRAMQLLLIEKLPVTDFHEHQHVIKPSLIPCAYTPALSLTFHTCLTTSDEIIGS